MDSTLRALVVFFGWLALLSILAWALYVAFLEKYLRSIDEAWAATITASKSRP